MGIRIRNEALYGLTVFPRRNPFLIGPSFHPSTMSDSLDCDVEVNVGRRPSITRNANLGTAPYTLEDRNPPSTPTCYEKLTNFGSLGMPSLPIPAFLKRCSMYTLRASSKPMPRIFIRR